MNDAESELQNKELRLTDGAKDLENSLAKAQNSLHEKESAEKNNASTVQTAIGRLEMGEVP